VPLGSITGDKPIMSGLTIASTAGSPFAAL
jgi:hypothetical protein